MLAPERSTPTTNTGPPADSLDAAGAGGCGRRGRSPLDRVCSRGPVTRVSLMPGPGRSGVRSGGCPTAARSALALARSNVSAISCLRAGVPIAVAGAVVSEPTRTRR